MLFLPILLSVQPREARGLSAPL